MNELSTKRTMTVKEVAEIIGVSADLVKKTIRELYPDLMENGKTTYLSEYQVTRLQENIEKNPHLLQSSQVMTSLRKKEIIMQAWQILNEEIEELKKENEVKQLRINRLIHDGKTYTTTEIAKELNLKSATELNKILSDKGIQYKQNHTWILSAKYSDQGYESIKQEELDNGRIIYNRHWTGKGRDFILDQFELNKIENL